MTKKEMVAAIQLAEARAWKDYRISQKHSAEDDYITARRKHAWLAIYELKHQLGIESLDVQSLIRHDLVPA